MEKFSGVCQTQMRMRIDVILVLMLGDLLFISPEAEGLYIYS